MPPSLPPSLPQRTVRSLLFLPSLTPSLTRCFSVSLCAVLCCAALCCAVQARSSAFSRASTREVCSAHSLSHALRSVRRPNVCAHSTPLAGCVLCCCAVFSVGRVSHVLGAGRSRDLPVDGRCGRAQEDCQACAGGQEQPITLRVPGRQQGNIPHRPEVRLATRNASQHKCRHRAARTQSHPLSRGHCHSCTLSFLTLSLCLSFTPLCRSPRSCCLLLLLLLCGVSSRVTTLIARRGFIRLALEHGCDLVPTMVFREKYMYNVYHAAARSGAVLPASAEDASAALLGPLPHLAALPHAPVSIAFDAAHPQSRASSSPSDGAGGRSCGSQFKAAGWRSCGTKYKTTYGYDGDDERLEIRDADRRGGTAGQTSSSSSSEHVIVAVQALATRSETEQHVLFPCRIEHLNRRTVSIQRRLTLCCSSMREAAPAEHACSPRQLSLARCELNIEIRLTLRCCCAVDLQMSAQLLVSPA